MARLVGVDLPRDKRLEVGLTYIYGIGRSSAQKMLAATGVDGNQRVRDVSENDLIALREYIDTNFQTEGDLRRGLLPTFGARSRSAPTRASGIAAVAVRGQRTHTNARTRKGLKKTVAGKKKATK